MLTLSEYTVLGAVGPLMINLLYVLTFYRLENKYRSEEWNLKKNNPNS